MEGRWDGVHLQGQAELGWGGMYEGHRVGRCGVGNGRHWELGRGWEKTRSQHREILLLLRRSACITASESC